MKDRLGEWSTGWRTGWRNVGGSVGGQVGGTLEERWRNSLSISFFIPPKMSSKEIIPGMVGAYRLGFKKGDLEV